MDYNELIDAMTPELYERMRRALEIGKWPDGKPLTPQQREQTMQAVILWGERHLESQERVGFIGKKKKEGEDCDSAPGSASDRDENSILQWKD
ncbi:MAG: YeaC family protein [Halioglobus sp.]